MPMLRSIEGEHVGNDFQIGDEPLIIGRRESCGIVINHTKVSRSHAKVYRRRERCYVVDLESSNGTYVNAIKLKPGQPRELEAGDEIRVAQTIFRYFDSNTGLPDIEIPGHKIIELIAEGGMGKIYRGRQLAMDRDVAIKILNPEYAARKEFVGRFIQEARAAGKLNHPNIIQVHNVGKVGDSTYYFTMELVKGANLTQRLGSARGLELKTIINAGIKVADALAYAHERGVIHKDVKPDNIVIADNGEVKLADLGIAKTSGRDDAEGQHRRVLGTPHYMSPEQAQGKPVDERSDIYSLGATLFHVIADEPLFDAPKSTEVMAMHVRQSPRSLAEVTTNVPKYVCDVVDKLLAKDPADRYQTATEARDELARVLAKLNKTGPRKRTGLPAGGVRKSSETGSRPAVTAARNRKRNNAVQFVVFAGVAVAVLGLAYLFLPSDFTIGATPSGGHGARPSSPVSGDAKASAWKEAQAAMDRGALEEARRRFQAFAARFASDPQAVSDANNAIAEVEKAMRRRRRLDAAKKAWDDYAAYQKRNSNDPKALLARLRKLRERYPSLEKKIDTQIALVRKAQARKAEILFTGLVERVNALARTLDFDGALAAISDFRAEHPDHPRLGDLADLENNVIADARKQLDKFRKEIAALRAARNYPGIRSRCNRFKREVKYDRFTPEVDRIQNKVNEEVRAEFNKLLGPVYKQMEERDFSAAQSTLDRNRMRFLTPPFNAKLKEIEELINGLRGLHERTISAINKAEPWAVPPESACEHLRGMSVIGADRLGLKVKRGPVATSVRWDKLTTAEIAQVYAQYVPPSSKYRKYVQTYKRLFVK